MKKLIASLSAVILFSIIFNGCNPDVITPENPDQNNQTEQPEEQVGNAQIELASTQKDVVVADPSDDSFNIRFMSSAAWKASVEDGADWVTLSPTEGEAGTGKVGVKVSRNDSEGDRTATVKITAGNASVQVLIEQAMFVPTFDLSMSSKEISAKGGVISVVVSTDVEYYYDIIPDWITVVESKLVFDYHHQFNIEPNPLPEPRTGMITFCAGGMCKAINITQRAAGTEADDWKVDEFHHRSLALRFTADWCGYCPYMATAFSSVKSSMKDRFEMVSLHGDASTYEFAGTTTLANRFKVSGFPTGVVDGRAIVQNSVSTDVTASVAKEVAEETQATYPATTGIACSSTLEGTTLNVNVDLYAKEADTYKLVVLLLEDNIVGYQNGGGNSYEHNDVARMALTPIMGDEVVAANDFEICSKSYTAEIKSSWKAENLRLMIYVEKPYGERERVKGVANAKYNNESTYVDNCRSIPVGVNAELELN